MAAPIRTPKTSPNLDVQLQLLQHDQLLRSISTLTELVKVLTEGTPLHTLTLEALEAHVKPFIPSKVVSING